MKIIENTSQRLVIVARPWFFAAMLLVFAGLFAFVTAVNWHKMGTAARLAFALPPIFALGLLLGAVRWVHVSFDRTLGRIDITQRGLMGVQENRYTLADLQGVRSDEDSDGGSYRVVLSFSERMLQHMRREEREKMQRRWKRGFRSVPPNDVPLTPYYASNIDGPALVAAIRIWAGLAPPTGTA